MTLPDWERLEARAAALGMLDELDRTVLATITARAGRAQDPVLGIILSALLAAIKEGGVRLTLDPEQLAAALAAWLRGLAAPIARTSPGTPIEGGEALAADLAAAAEWNPAHAAAIAAQCAARFAEGLGAGTYATVISPDGGFLPLVTARGGLYFQKHHAAESLAGRQLARLLALPAPDHAPEAIAAAMEAVLSRRPLRIFPAAGPDALVFDPAQRAALTLALSRRFSVITGGPGTGKTSLAANLLRAWMRLWQGAEPPRIKLAAPTGRAAQRLTESLRRSVASLDPDSRDGAEADDSLQGITCVTLHALLRYQSGEGGFFHHAHRPLPADLILIDEVSMVDIFLLARLLDSLESGATLILLGDMDQLPAVEAGSVLADLMPRGEGESDPLRGHLAVLDRSHRSDEALTRVAKAINAMASDEALAAMAPPSAAEGSAAKAGCRLDEGPEAGPRAGWPTRLEAWVVERYLGPFPGPDTRSYAEVVRALGTLPDRDDSRLGGWLEAAFARLEAARILTFTRKGWHGCERINHSLCERLVRECVPRFSGEASEGFPGMPVLILANDSALGLANGDVGLRLRIAGRETVWFRRADGFQEFAPAFLPKHEPAFALTVHKAQGSEYDAVLIVLPEEGNRLLAKETVYTALTRARQTAVIYGSEAVFRSALTRRTLRESGLRELLSKPND